MSADGHYGQCPRTSRTRGPHLFSGPRYAARDSLVALLERGMLMPTTSKGPVRLGFPIDALERWLPKLYPGDLIGPKKVSSSEGN